MRGLRGWFPAIRERAGRVLGKLGENWEQTVLRPVFNSLLTALVLFSASLFFQPVRSFLFPPREARDYPLVCTAEPYMDESGKHVLVDFFVINRTAHAYTREELDGKLRLFYAGQAGAASADIRLRYKDSAHRAERFFIDPEFNREKGKLAIDLGGAQAAIKVDSIAERAVMKVTFRFTLPEQRLYTIQRMAKITVPFEFGEFEDACYTHP